MATFQRDDVTLAYDDIGGGDPPLVFLHGLGGARGTFGPQVERFGGEHRLLLVDQRGHGQSSHVLFSIPACADDVAALVQDRGLRKPVVIGFSSGGVIALDMAARHGELLAGVILLDAPILLPEALRASMGPVVAGMHSPQAVETWVGFVTSLFSPLDDEALKGPVVDQIRRTPGDVLTAGFDGNGAFDVVAALKACRIPLLYVAAAMPSDLSVLRAYCPHAMIGQAVGTGHFAHQAAPDQVNAMIARFLYSLTRSAAV